MGNAGSVNTGSFDDLDALADLAQEEALWLHVDGAFGAVAALSPELRRLVAGMERADSVAFDFHKWLHVPYNVGCTLFKDENLHRDAFSVSGSYLSVMERGVGAQSRPGHEFGPELSREAKALTIWMALREHGLSAYGAMAHENVKQAQYLARLVLSERRLELLAPVSLNIVCLRYLPENHQSWNPDSLDRLNKEILMDLQQKGIAVPSHTVLNGRFGIRVCITNHRTRSDDFDLAVRAILDLGKDAVRRLGQGPDGEHRSSELKSPLDVPSIGGARVG